jgi:hypothetical protein
MKALASALVWMLLQPLALAAEPDGKLTLPDFNALTARATDSVSITLDPALLAMAARFLDSADPQDAAVRDMIGELKGIYVKSYTFAKDFAYPAGSIEAVRQQLNAPGWQRIVEVHSAKQGSSVDIFVCQVQGKTRGLAIIAAEPREFTIVNVVGAIDLAKLHKLEGHFGIPKIAPAQ